MTRRASLLFILPLLIFLVVVYFLWQGINRNPHRIPSPFIGKALPTFSMPSLYHPNQKLTNREWLGHVFLLNVFATWCISCHAEHPVLMDIHDSGRVPIYGIDYKDHRKKAKQWLAQFGDPYKDIIFDAKGQLGINLGIYGTPATFVVDKKGIIRYKYIGPMSPDAWNDTVWPIVEKLQREKL